jgi:hypothetical protein
MEQVVLHCIDCVFEFFVLDQRTFLFREKLVLLGLAHLYVDLFDLDF